MTKREKKIMEIAVEIDRLLTDGIEIHPNSPIHEKLSQALRQYGVMQRSEQLCGFFEADNKTSSATKCKCGSEKWEHPKAT